MEEEAVAEAAPLEAPQADQVEVDLEPQRPEELLRQIKLGILQQVELTLH